MIEVLQWPKSGPGCIGHLVCCRAAPPPLPVVHTESFRSQSEAPRRKGEAIEGNEWCGSRSAWSLPQGAAEAAAVVEAAVLVGEAWSSVEAKLDFPPVRQSHPLPGPAVEAAEGRVSAKCQR